MTLLRWRASMSLGVPTIDADHKHLIEILNRLHFLKLAGDDSASLGNVLGELVEYTRNHFAREESLMRRCGFPGFAHHRQQHQAICEALADFHLAFHTDPAGFDMRAFYDFVADWLLVHVMREDMKLRPHLVKAGLFATAG